MYYYVLYKRSLEFCIYGNLSKKLNIRCDVFAFIYIHPYGHAQFCQFISLHNQVTYCNLKTLCLAKYTDTDIANALFLDLISGNKKSI